MLLNPFDRQRGPALVMAYDLTLQSYCVVGVDSVLANNTNSFWLGLVVGIADIEAIGCDVTSLVISGADVVTEVSSLGVGVADDEVVSGKPGDKYTVPDKATDAAFKGYTVKSIKGGTPKWYLPEHIPDVYLRLRQVNGTCDRDGDNAHK